MLENLCIFVQQAELCIPNGPLVNLPTAQPNTAYDD